MTVFSLVGLAARMAAAEAAVTATVPQIIEAACKMLCEQARDEIGVDAWGWPPLGPDALARHGNTPLLETGQLKASISWNASGNEGHVGSDHFTAEWHEFGTSRMPARAFLATALRIEEKAIVAMARRAIAAAVMSGTSPVHELMHLLREAGHLAREAGRLASEPIEGDQ